MGNVFMQRVYLRVVTALSEGVTGVLLLVLPSVPQKLLLGLTESSPQTFVVARIAGAALFALSIACWFGRSDEQRGLLTSVLVYDVAAAVVLGYTGLFLVSSASPSGLRLCCMPGWPSGVLSVS
jgi:hypothetical protein